MNSIYLVKLDPEWEQPRPGAITDEVWILYRENGLKIPWLLGRSLEESVTEWADGYCDEYHKHS